MKPARNLFVWIAAALSYSAAAPAATSAAMPFVLDLAGNGIDLGGQVTTTLFGTSRSVRWTKPASDDAFLVGDASALRKAGYDWLNEAGARLSGPQLVRGGTRLKLPDGKLVAIGDAWHFLTELDADADGRLSAADAGWAALSLFNDTDADGSLQPAELMALGSSGVQSIGLSHSGPTRDPYGNQRSDGSYRTGSGQTRVASGVTLATLPPR